MRVKLSGHFDWNTAISTFAQFFTHLLKYSITRKIIKLDTEIYKCHPIKQCYIHCEYLFQTWQYFYHCNALSRGKRTLFSFYGKGKLIENIYLRKHYNIITTLKSSFPFIPWWLYNKNSLKMKNTQYIVWWQRYYNQSSQNSFMPVNVTNKLYSTIKLIDRHAKIIKHKFTLEEFLSLEKRARKMLC